MSATATIQKKRYYSPGSFQCQHLQRNKRQCVRMVRRQFQIPSEGEPIVEYRCRSHNPNRLEANRLNALAAYHTSKDNDEIVRDITARVSMLDMSAGLIPPKTSPL